MGRPLLADSSPKGFRSLGLECIPQVGVVQALGRVVGFGKDVASHLLQQQGHLDYICLEDGIILRLYIKKSRMRACRTARF